MKASIFILLFSFLGLIPDEKESMDYKYQLVVFEGSDWCMNCRRLEKNILSVSKTVNFLEKKKIEILRVDFPQRKKMSNKQERKNESLAEQFEFSGKYPELVLAKKDGSNYRKIVYDNLSVLEFMTIITMELEALK